MPIRCNRWFLLQILLLTQHVSGTIMPIIRTSRVFYKWLLPVVFGALVFKLSVWCGAEGYVSGLRAAAPHHTDNLKTKAPNTTGSNHLYNTLEVLMMGIMVPKTCWASNKICNKNHLLHHVIKSSSRGNNDDLRNFRSSLYIISVNSGTCKTCRGNEKCSQSCGDRDSVGGIETCYGPDGAGFESRWWWFFPCPIRPAPRPTERPAQLGTWSLPRVKRPGRNAAHSPPTATRLRIIWSCTSASL